MDPGIRLVRHTLAATMMIHGVYRIADGGVEQFGGFLTSKGFPFGVALAAMVTGFELVGASLLFAGRWVQIAAGWFVFQLAMGIVLVHAENGWFVVGAGRNGIEYSVVLILGFVAVILSERRRASG